MSSEGIGQASSTSEKIVLIVDDDRDVGDILQKIILDQTDYYACSTPRLAWLCRKLISTTIL